MSKSKNIKSLKITARDEEWDLSFTREDLGTDCWGVCLHGQKRMLVNPDLRQNDMLDTAIHEVLHAAIPDIKEHIVSDATESVMELLKKMGVCNKKWA